MSVEVKTVICKGTGNKVICTYCDFLSKPLSQVMREPAGMVQTHIITLKFINFNFYLWWGNVQALTSSPTLFLIKLNFKIKNLWKWQVYCILLLLPKMNGDQDKILVVGN